jgi:4-amino-4-deoxy-L-arabinose transferase-like glycosyltransferase
MSSSSVEIKTEGYRSERGWKWGLWNPSFLTVSNGLVVLAMVSLQVAWLAAILVLRVSGDEAKVPLIVGYTILAGLLAFAARPAMLVRGLALLIARPTLRALVYGSVCLVVGLLYASEQRIWPYDEEGLYAAAKGVADQGPLSLFTSYRSHPWLGRQHPPLAPLLYGGFLSLFGDHLFTARLLSLTLLAGIGTLTFFIARELYDTRTGVLATGFLLSMPLMWRIGTAAMVEPLLILLFCATLFLTLRFVRAPGTGLAIAVGLAFACGLLAKYTMLLIVPVLIGFCAVRLTARNFLKALALGGLIGLPLVSIWGFYAWHNGLLVKHLTWIWFAGMQVIRFDYGRQLLFETMTNRLPSALGVYNLPFIGLGVLQLVRRRSQADWLILLWIIPVFSILTVTLPDHRYFMVLFPAFAIAMASGLSHDDTRAARILLLASLLCAGSLYLFVDWERVTHLFLDQRYVGPSR